ncbi:MAG: hypothetical protein ACREAK_11585, partial [Nitrosarchaeum sp.]
FRRYFATIVKNNPKISFSISERLLGHQSYLDNAYFQPTTEELFRSFKVIIPDLLIDQTEIQTAKIKYLEEVNSDAVKVKEKLHDMSQLVLEYDKLASSEDFRRTMRIMEIVEKDPIIRERLSKLESGKIY